MTDLLPDAKPGLPQNLTPEQARAMLFDQFAWPVMCTTLNGLRMSLPQFDIGTIVVRACGLFGRVIGETLSRGSLVDILKIRKACQDAFIDAMRKVEIKAEEMPQDDGKIISH